MPNIDQFKTGEEPSEVSLVQYPEIRGTKCWLWIGNIDVHGYGRITVRGKRMLAHRYSFYLRYGHYPNPCGLHKCDVKSCVNPEHIFEGTRQQNAKDRDVKGRGNQPKGSKNAHAKLTEAQVKKIKHSPATTTELTKRFKVAWTTIYDIRKRGAWKHVY